MTPMRKKPAKLVNHDAQALLSTIRACRKCADVLSKEFVDPIVRPNERVEPRPIAPPIRHYPVFLIGQAPGLTEYERRESFQGPAGQGIRKVFKEAGVSTFDEIVYSTAIVKCFPGSKVNNRGRRTDCIPSDEMVRNCRPYLLDQKSLVQPDVVVTLGKFPLQYYLTIRGRSRLCRLEDFVGTAEEWDGAQVVFLPHTSGNSFWLNSTENQNLFQKAKVLLKEALIEKGIVSLD